MQRLLSDQNFNARLIEGVLRASNEITCVSVREFGMSEAVDPRLLAFAAEGDYIFLTHDARTVPRFVYELVLAGESPPRVIVVPELMPIGSAVEEIVILLLAGTDHDWQRDPFRLPL